MDPKSSWEEITGRPIEYFIAHATGELSELRDPIEKALSRAIPTATKELGAEGIDIIVLPEPAIRFEKLQETCAGLHGLIFYKSLLRSSGLIDRYWLQC